MDFKKWFLKEDFEQWNGRWIHYSRQPYMKINYKMNWNDPLGIYFFPEKFENSTNGSWNAFPYKYVVEFPSSMKVFDFSKFDKNDFKKILDDHNIPIAPDLDKKAWDKDQTYFESDPARTFWESIKHHCGISKTYGAGSKAKMNAFFRRTLGYDAIFDDTNSVYHGENQLILLNPGVNYKVVDVVHRSGTGWKEMEALCTRIKAIGNEYGPITMGKMKREYSGWSNEVRVHTTMSIGDGSRETDKRPPYVYFEMSTSQVEHKKPQQIYVHLSWASHYYDRSKGTIGITLELRKMDWDALDKYVTEILQNVWTAASEQEAA